MEEGDFAACGLGFSEYQNLLMRRLLSLFRSPDDHHTICNETECINSIVSPSLLPPPQSDTNMMMMLMMGWFAVAVALFYLRPASLRNRNISKPSDSSGSGSDGPPPGAPPAVN